MTQKSKLLLRNKRSKKKLSLSHQLEPSMEKERTSSKWELSQILSHKELVKLMKLELLAWPVLNLSENQVKFSPAQTELGELENLKLEEIQLFSHNTIPTHTDKPPLRESSPILMTQKSKLLLKSKRSKKKLLPSHQLEPSMEKERTSPKWELFLTPFHKELVKLMKLELLAWPVLNLSENQVKYSPTPTDHGELENPKLEEIQSFSTKSKPTHMVKPPLRENSHILMIQKFKPLSISKKSKMKLSPSHQ